MDRRTSWVLDTTVCGSPDTDELREDEGVRDGVHKPIFQKESAHAELSAMLRFFSSGEVLFFSTESVQFQSGNKLFKKFTIINLISKSFKQDYIICY